MGKFAPWIGVLALILSLGSVLINAGGSSAQVRIIAERAAEDVVKNADDIEEVEREAHDAMVVAAEAKRVATQNQADLKDVAVILGRMDERLESIDKSLALLSRREEGR